MRKGLQIVAVLLGSIVFGTASVCLSLTARVEWYLQILTYAVYALAALFLAGAVWVMVSLFRQNIWGKFRDAAHRISFTGRLYDDYGFRTLFAGHLSLLVNIFFALTKAAAGWYFSSAWLSALAFYYLILCLTKALVLRRGRQKIPGETEAQKLRREWRTYRMCGVLLMLLTLALQGVIILIVKRGNAFLYWGTLIFAVAAYDFYCLISNIVFMVRTRRKHTPLVVALKSISFATSLVSMLTLQTAMFASFSDGINAFWQKLMNLMTGTAVCVILILWGALMVRRAQKELRGNRNDSYSGG